MCAEEHKATTPQVASARVDNGESNASGHGGVNGVAAFAKDIKAGVGGKMMDADDHSMAGTDGLFIQIGNHVLRGLLGWNLGYGLGNGGERL
jgi:hypothetical protein